MFDLNGLALRISTVSTHAAQPHTVLGWAVPDIAVTARELCGKGVVFTIHAGFGQDELGIWTAPGVTQVA